MTNRKILKNTHIAKSGSNSMGTNACFALCLKRYLHSGTPGHGCFPSSQSFVQIIKASLQRTSKAQGYNS